LAFPSERLDRLTSLEEGGHFWFEGRRRLLEAVLRRDLQRRGQFVLDLGSGTGWALDMLRRLGHRGIGVDALTPPVDPTNAQSTDRFLRSDATRLPFADSTFDAVLALDVLEHVDDVTALSEVHRVLRPEGVIVATVPAFPRLWSDRDVVAGHRRRYTRATLRATLKASRFSVRSLRGYQFLLLPVIAASRMLGKARSDSKREEELPPVLNRAFERITDVELRLGRHVPWPVGLSLVVVAGPLA
jgi:SAM-dependent methyltransferase